MTNLNYYWQKRNEQEQKTRDREKLNEDFEAGLAKRASDEKIKKLEEELEAKSRKPVANSNVELDAYYRGLLSKPMLEIAKVNENFKETYLKQQEVLAEWMVNQKAFKEIMLKIALENGKSEEEVMIEVENAKIKVLNNETEFGNNFVANEDDKWAAFYAPRVKTRMGIKD